jgi:hypothetical protein
MFQERAAGGLWDDVGDPSTPLLSATHPASGDKRRLTTRVLRVLKNTHECWWWPGLARFGEVYDTHSSWGPGRLSIVLSPLTFTGIMRAILFASLLASASAFMVSGPRGRSTQIRMSVSDMIGIDVETGKGMGRETLYIVHGGPSGSPRDLSGVPSNGGAGAHRMGDAPCPFLARQGARCSTPWASPRARTSCTSSARQS